LTFDSRERVGRIIRSTLLKTRSLAAELAGTKNLRNKLRKNLG